MSGENARVGGLTEWPMTHNISLPPNTTQLINFLGVATLLAPVALATCGKWDVHIYQGDVCGRHGETANNVYMDDQPRGCESLDGYSVDLNNIGDCTCSNSLTCPKQVDVASDGTIKCDDLSHWHSFSVEASLQPVVEEHNEAKGSQRRGHQREGRPRARWPSKGMGDHTGELDNASQAIRRPACSCQFCLPEIGEAGVGSRSFSSVSLRIIQDAYPYRPASLELLVSRNAPSSQVGHLKLRSGIDTEVHAIEKCWRLLM
ncbi:hypothetical protein ABEF95_011897 [Exophiala dermatitidis]